MLLRAVRIKLIVSAKQAMNTIYMKMISVIFFIFKFYENRLVNSSDFNQKKKLLTICMINKIVFLKSTYSYFVFAMFV